MARRIGVLLLAVVQMAGAVALPAADGALDVERYSLPVHVESEGRDDCAPHHDHAFCQVVRSTALGNPAPPAAEAPTSALAAVRIPRPLAGPRVDAQRVLVGASGPRAPPTA